MINSKLFLVIALITILVFLSYLDSLVTQSIGGNEIPLQKAKATSSNQVKQDSLFTDISNTLKGVKLSSVAWGDYDNDGYLDILLTGTPGFGGFSEVYKYKKDDSTFSEIKANLERVNDSSVAWGDYDNDGDLDILLTGFTRTKNVSKIYFNNNGQFVEDTTAQLQGVSSSAVAWGDYDNDGDLDILLTGVSNSDDDISIIYCNNDTSFNEVAANLPGVRKGSVAWGDYDNDGDLDILLTGLNSSTHSYLSKIYRNANGNFVDTTNARLTGVCESSAAWGDYDQDGDLDILLTGEDQFNTRIAKIYQNNDGIFVETKDTLQGVYQSSVAWGDYDNDGDLDILLTGENTNGKKISKVYKNENGHFIDINANLIAVSQSSVAWGDYNKDGDLDILLTGWSNSGFVAKIYQNNNDSSNNAPISPDGLKSVVDYDSVILSWNKSNDSETDQNALTYNLRIGTTSGGTEIMSPMANLNTGYRMVPKLGNVNHNNIWVIKNLKESINYYYWSVQSIDNSFAGSQFAQEDSFIIGNPPVIHDISEVSPEESLSVTIEATVSDDFGVKSIILYSRRGGDTTITFSNSMIWENGKYQIDIPGSMVTSRGLEYYIEAKDFGGSEDREPRSGFFSIQVYVPNGVEKDSLQPSGSDKIYYRQISVPLDLNNKNPKAVLEDDLGTYDDTKWRFFEPFPDRDPIEFPNTSDMEPGKAFWLIIKNAEKPIDTGAGKTILTSKPFSKDLQRGWNSIGNPFHFIIPIKNIRLKSNSNSPELRYFNGSWNNPSSDPVEQIIPFEGYAIFNNSSDVDTLFINPDLSDMTILPLEPLGLTHENNLLWKIRVLARCQKASDIDNEAIVVMGASQDWDEMDRPEPPVIGEYVSVYFPHPEWKKNTSSYCTDSRPEPVEGEIWEFEVKTNIPDKVKLTFEGLERVPEEFNIWLMDEKLKITQNLRAENNYFVAGPSENHAKRLKLVVGRHDFVEERINKVNVVPASYELFQNFPNPFNPATTIRYGLPKAGKVTLTVYNILGEEIAILVDDEKKSAGYHISIWDARNRQEQNVANGIYIYQLRVGNLGFTKKMFLVK